MFEKEEVGKVPFTKEEVKKYLDDMIRSWGQIVDKKGILTSEDVRMKTIAPYYLNAIQKIRKDLFGQTLDRRIKNGKKN